MEWSNYQNEIFAFVGDARNGSCVVNAVAGSGKTTTIVECAKREAVKGLKILFVAFNKSIADELSARMNGTGVECKTLHSHGFRALNKTLWKSGKVVIDNNKWSKYIKENFDVICSKRFTEDDKVLKMECIGRITNLLDKCRINLIKSGETRAISEIADHFGIIADDAEIQCVSDILANAYKPQLVCDFTDMITTSVFSCSRNIPRYDLVFVDEAQDLNKAEQELLLKSLNPNGRFVAVGDPKQAINGFAGSDAYSFEYLKRLANNNELPLSVCYRCGTKMIEMAQKIVPNIKAREGAIEGQVLQVRDFKTIKGGDMVLCRLSAPLVGLCLKFLAKGISAKVKGRDIAEGLKKMVEKANAKNLNYLWDKLDNEVEKMRKHLEKKGKVAEEESAYLTLKDKIDCIKVIAEDCKSIKELLNKFDTIFADSINGNTITLSTIHKAKGLESDNVYIICPDKLPMKHPNQQDWEIEQEQNLCYVAYTRAKKNLVFVNLGQEALAKVEI